MIYLLENKIPQLKKASFLLVFSIMFAGMGCKSDKILQLEPCVVAFQNSMN